MKVCVTGASGFIGRHVCLALTRAGHTVIGLDIMSNVVLRQNFSENGSGTIVYTTPPCDQWITGDITKPLEKIPDLDAVVHLAAIAAPRDCDSDPARAFAVNVNGTHQVLKMAYQSGAEKLIFSSSAHVYDIPPKYLPTDEVHPLRLNNTYTTTKILGEQLCQLYYENHGLSYIALRLYNAYGPGQAKGYFIPDQIAKAQAGNFELKGSDVTKDWVYIDDVADAFVRAVSNPFVGAINIGTGHDTTLGTIARVIANEYGVELATYPASQPSHMRCDWRRARAILGWQPRKTIQEGIFAAIDSAKTSSVPA